MIDPKRDEIWIEYHSDFALLLPRSTQAQDWLVGRDVDGMWYRPSGGTPRLYINLADLAAIVRAGQERFVFKTLSVSVGDGVEVNTARYEYMHGQRPRGNGLWTFEIGKDLFQVSANYGEAVRAATATAKARSITRVSVLP